MEKRRAIETARLLYGRYGKRNRGGAFWRIRPTLERFHDGRESWAVQIEVRRGLGGAAFTRGGAQWVAADLLRLWNKYGPHSSQSAERGAESSSVGAQPNRMAAQTA